MINVQFPPPQFNIKKEGEQHYIFDLVRKTWLLLTEEEWVRQNFVAYLIKELQYPAEMIGLEKEIAVNQLKKRFDILIFDSQHRPWMLVECKAPQVCLNEDVLQQALRYHITVPAKYIVITNGGATKAWKKQGSALVLAAELPQWNK